MLRNAFVSAFARSLEGSKTLRIVNKNLRDVDLNKPAESKDKDDKKPAKPKPGARGKR